MYVFLAWMQLDITQTLFHGAGRLKSFCSGCLPSHVHLCWVMSKKFRAALVCLDKQAVVPVIWLCLPSYLCRGGQKKVMLSETQTVRKSVVFIYVKLIHNLRSCTTCKYFC